MASGRLCRVTSMPTAQPSGPFPEDASLYDAVGGEETFRRLVHRFYAGVAEDPVLRPLYPEDHLGPAEERLRMFLIQYWGGPRDYSEQRGHPRLRMRHAPFRITEVERDAWLRRMRLALDELDLPAAYEQTAMGLPRDGRLEPGQLRIARHISTEEQAEPLDVRPAHCDAASRALQAPPSGGPVCRDATRRAEESQQCGRVRGPQRGISDHRLIPDLVCVVLQCGAVTRGLLHQGGPLAEGLDAALNLPGDVGRLGRTNGLPA